MIQMTRPLHPIETKAAEKVDSYLCFGNEKKLHIYVAEYPCEKSDCYLGHFWLTQ